MPMPSPMPEPTSPPTPTLMALTPFVGGLFSAPLRVRIGRLARQPMLVALLMVSGVVSLSAPGSAAALQVIDDTGHVVTLAGPARRIISLAPHLTEQLFAIGAGGRIVGAVAYSDHPAAARQVPRVGDHAQLDLERIVTLRPDLVVAWDSGNAGQQLQRLAGLGLPIYRSEAREFADISSTLRRLGDLTGQTAAAQQHAAGFDSALAALRKRYAGRREVSVFYQIWHQPLLTVNRDHLISQALTLCGARNVFASIDALTPQVSEEAVWAADPEAIVTGSVDPRGPDNLDRWRDRKGLSARARGHLIVVNPDTLHRATTRVVEGVAELCEKLDTVRLQSRAAPALR
jgi:iron complex transport system substrate-binding protein